MVKGGSEKSGHSATSSTSSQPPPRLSGLRVGTFNIRSVSDKSSTVTRLKAELKLDVLTLQETWHENIDSLSLRSAVPPGYSLAETAREVKPSTKLQSTVNVWGGVAIIYRSEYKMKKVTTLPRFKTFEFVCCRLNAVHHGE
jgi:exonuclease III